MTVRKLGVVYQPGSIPILTLVAAIDGRWPLVWIVHEPLAPRELRMLRRFGECVELGGVEVAESAERLRQLGVGGITTFADAGLLQVAALGTALGVPVNPPEVALRLTSKLEQRTALAAAGLPTPRFCQLDPGLPEDALRRSTDGLTFPVVVKPAVGTGGRDTLSVGSLTDLTAELGRRRSLGDMRTLIVEECLGPYPPQAINGYGDYGSVEIVVAAGRLVVLAVTGRMPLAPPFRETGMFAPSHLDSDEQETVAATAASAVRALGVEVGCMHVEIKLTADGPRVIEVNGRVPGGGIPDIVLTASGDDLYAAAAAAAMGEPVSQTEARSACVSYAFALQPPVGQPSRLVSDWRKRLTAVPGVRQFELRAESATVQPSDGSYGYLLLVGGEVASHEALHGVQAQLKALIEPDPELEFQRPATDTRLPDQPR